MLNYLFSFKRRHLHDDYMKILVLKNQTNIHVDRARAVKVY